MSDRPFERISGELFSELYGQYSIAEIIERAIELAVSETREYDWNLALYEHAKGGNAADAAKRIAHIPEQAGDRQDIAARMFENLEKKA